MKLEIDSIHSNQVWTLIDPLEGIVPIGCKWIYRKKIGADGKIELYRARLVAKDYSQCNDIDYQEIFSPVAVAPRLILMITKQIEGIQYFKMKKSLCSSRAKS